MFIALLDSHTLQKNIRFQLQTIYKRKCICDLTNDMITSCGHQEQTSIWLKCAHAEVFRENVDFRQAEMKKIITVEKQQPKPIKDKR